ncbi:hypothetical protein BN946_scf184836.g62 [Trametes cinnabarina]|uniref:Uncharacterized protein n=1 Tax=Pycnoporus cinnabarinus TaxID=5643 RepID=A0A060SC66_PYCCI|nr:hypothetical protein BN946_scf184836.g62 [Trametes cinnabarina]
MDPSYPAFPILSFLGFVLVLVPLPWHLQAWNSGTCLFIFWTAIASLNLFVNSVVWHGNALNTAPIWCDISYVVSGHRFDIYEDIGCQPAIYTTPFTFPLLLCWPIVIGLVSGVYCAMSLYAFNKRRAQFVEFMSAHSALTITRYFRLMAIAMTDLLCSVPISAYGIYLNIVDGGINPWISWDDTHFQFWRVDQVPAAFWRASRDTVISFELARWLIPFCAFMFFAFFGFAAEARAYYARLLNKVLNLLGVTRADKLPHSLFGSKAGQSLSSSSKSSHALPTFCPRPPPPPFTSLSFGSESNASYDLDKASSIESGAPPYEVRLGELPDTSSTSCSEPSTPCGHHAA